MSGFDQTESSLSCPSELPLLRFKWTNSHIWVPHPQQGFPRPILLSIPHRGGFFPGEIGNKLLFQKKFGKSRAVGCMFMQKLERTFAMETQLPGAKARAGGGVGEIPGVWAFSGTGHFACVLGIYAHGLQNIPKIPGKLREMNEYISRKISFLSPSPPGLVPFLIHFAQAAVSII